MSVGYIDHDGQEISTFTWERLREDKGYRVPLAYYNPHLDIRAAVEWMGTVGPHHWPWYFECQMGKETSRTEYGLKEEAVNAYEAFLVENTHCEWVPTPTGEMRLLEVGNSLTDNAPTQDTTAAKTMQQGIVDHPDYASW